MGPVVRVKLYNDDVNGTVLALLYAMEEAGMALVHDLDPEVGGVFDIVARNQHQARKLQQGLERYHLKAVVVNPT